ncbi:hypothetical protein J4405_05700 [Candidatus Woesearchaeota archaeon]|nr:hypothetical protein [Candidatus Woesearchaeota archaeon]
MVYTDRTIELVQTIIANRIPFKESFSSPTPLKVVYIKDKNTTIYKVSGELYDFDFTSNGILVGHARLICETNGKSNACNTREFVENIRDLRYQILDENGNPIPIEELTSLEPYPVMQRIRDSFSKAVVPYMRRLAHDLIRTKKTGLLPDNISIDKTVKSVFGPLEEEVSEEFKKTLRKYPDLRERVKTAKLAEALFRQRPEPAFSF